MNGDVNKYLCFPIVLGDPHEYSSMMLGEKGRENLGDRRRAETIKIHLWILNT